MSLSDVPAYAEESDVQAAMQEADVAFNERPLGTTNVETAIQTASRWFRRQTDAHFYDSTAAASDLISSSPSSVTDIRLSIPSSPHAQPGQLSQVADETRRQPSYPVTQVGQYARATTTAGEPRLPYFHVETIDSLEVRERGGELTDWVAANDKTEGRGEDYYLQTEGDSTGRSYLYIHAGALGPRQDFDDVLLAGVSFGADWQDHPWADVRRGIAHLAAAELVKDDDVLTAIPDGATINSVDTEVSLHLKYAFNQPGYLSSYLGRYIA